MPWHNILRQGISKGATESVFCWPSRAGLGAALKSSLKKAIFFFICKWLSIGYSFWVKDGEKCPFFFPGLGPHLGQTCDSIVLYPCEFKCVSAVLCLEGPLSWVFSIPSGS